MGDKFWYVYLLRSIEQVDRLDVGMTEHLEERLAAHNSGSCTHTSRFAPWRIETAIAFRHKAKAIAFERYLKSHSGRAFAVKHF